ncbi:MAG: adenosylmethionine--8-amino-7-oxononanoate transaminase [Verrucomicrobia bacterium CG_4_10_14_3_um_filter_43_23]|nr:MAG: adenosylmethionine--8-amino-7-oxononanoate transaminase [Verrucomicrobia bacterium CG1_02_43_26]PIP59721.1 MAG: adenosylmethionine--8-amino-7-oxononanoate transaminase [Verrucomicrobia bacterium CG22_combo_CG10-13_8_21_14_all_43_17]PIX57733.1 MAG: adenosylmethionine--8-amino-7-oxononanoate transaminase [Verrucomicrobia bacterium CG_4_10_14_3_um_filter_43_23]PIY62525.1 MAG: adenosylmethionine--8-amino-7-oxononanoate transaminase [Verrucomicrobia bacterium CG_4_10_14_0_8_um_filter_43_34]P
MECVIISDDRSSKVECILDAGDREHSWHPFTPMLDYLKEPAIHIAQGEGCWLYDTEGKRYLDACASNWTCLHGHNHPVLKAALLEQAEKLCMSTYKGASHVPGAKLNKKLADIAPKGLTRAFYTDNGSCAMEAALKMSLQYWQMIGRAEKRKVISMAGGYHGDTIGAMSMGDCGSFHERFKDWQFPSAHFRAPRCEEYGGRVFYEKSEESMSELSELLERQGHETACLVMEPWIQGPAGMRMQPKGYLKEVERLCLEHGVHLVLDEVFVSFGRVGELFVCKAEDVCPDFLCVAKGLTAGVLPMAATLVKEPIYEAYLGEIKEGKTFYHGHTFSGHPLAAAVACANIDLVEEMIACGELAKQINVFEKAVCRYFSGHDLISGIRQRGMVCAIDIDCAKQKINSIPLGYDVWRRLKGKGVLVRPLGDSLIIVPPLVMNASEFDFMFSRILETIEEAIG